jgi:hypothetical protein
MANKYMRALDLPTQDALKAKMLAIAEPDVRKSLELYAIARKLLYAAADAGSKYAIYLALSMGTIGGWGLPGCLRRANFETTHETRAFLVARNRSPYSVPTGDDILTAYSLMENGDFTFYESICHPSFFCASIYTLAIAEFGSSRGIMCLGSASIPKKYLTLMASDVLSQYVYSSRQERIFDVYNVLVTCRDVNMDELGERVVDYNKWAADVFRDIQFKQIDNDLLTYMSGEFGHELGIPLYTTRTRLYRNATICWLLCARRLRIYRDIALLIARLVYVGRFPVL